jgi:hypothetical protein
MDLCGLPAIRPQISVLESFTGLGVFSKCLGDSANSGMNLLCHVQERIAPKWGWERAQQDLQQQKKLGSQLGEQPIRIGHCVVKMRSNSQIAFADSNIDSCASQTLLPLQSVMQVQWANHD